MTSPKPSPQPAAGLTLDAGGLIALERGDRRVVALLSEAIDAGLSIAIPAGALGQAWRDGSRQVRLARLVGAVGVTVEPLDRRRAQAAGQLCGARASADVIDASVVLCARARGHRIVTSDPADLRRLDARLVLLVV